MFIRKPSAMGYTIIELLVVITIVGILSAIGISSYSNLQKDARDNQRASKIESLSAALERYYVENGEYPGCTQLVNQPVANIATNVLNGIDTEVLAAPNSSAGTNSLASCSDLSGASDIFAYVVPDEDDCTTGQSCLQYTLQYRKESTGQIVSVPSIHAAAIAATPTTPSVAVARVVDNVVATASASTCSSGTLQYSFSVSVNGASASNTNWSTIATSSQLAEQGKQYEYTARARCYVDQVTYSPVALSSPATYTAPITPPSAPVVVATNNGDVTTFSWTELTCSVGDVSSQYRFTVTPSGYDSGWVDTSDAQVVFTTATLGQTYTVTVHSMCANAFASSGWGDEGSASYIYSTFIAKYSKFSSGGELIRIPGGDYLTTFGGGITRLRPDGAVVWSKNYIVNDSDSLSGIALDQEGNIVAVGGTRKGCCSWIGVVAKLDDNGNLIWFKELSGPYSDVVINNDNYYTVGYARGISGDGDDEDLVMTKIDSNGNVLWNRYWGGSSRKHKENGSSVTLASDGGIVAVGRYRADCCGNFGRSFIVKYDQNGNLQWNVVGFGERPAKDVITLADGSFVVVGGGKSHTGDDDNRAYITKFNSSGSMLWTKEWYGLVPSEDNYSIFNGVSQKSNGKIVVVGDTSSYGYVDRDNTNGLVAQYDDNGNLEWSNVWSRQWGSQSYERFFDVDIDLSQNIVLVGAYNDALFARYSTNGVLDNCPGSICQFVTPLIANNSSVDYSPDTDYGVYNINVTDVDVSTITVANNNISPTYLVSP
jgi:prepilin-type N-terminal cleavage/methylation domain-containing protein